MDVMNYRHLYKWNR